MEFTSPSLTGRGGEYPTRGVDVSVASERFVLRDQAAQDITRYDFVKDLVRLERVVDADLATSAAAVLLTNDSAYWKESLRASSVDAAFRIAEGRRLAGRLAWASHAGVGTMRGRETPLALIRSHLVRWVDYSSFPGSYGTFRYWVSKFKAYRPKGRSPTVPLLDP
ncbi:MAG: hypothetical protein WD556_07650 [Actinomycetota bacterium]